MRARFEINRRELMALKCEREREREKEREYGES